MMVTIYRLHNRKIKLEDREVYKSPTFSSVSLSLVIEWLSSSSDVASEKDKYTVLAVVFRIPEEREI